VDRLSSAFFLIDNDKSDMKMRLVCIRFRNFVEERPISKLSSLLAVLAVLAYSSGVRPQRLGDNWSGGPLIK
jgi:hypothetical protein